MRYRKSYNITLDPEVREKIEKYIPQGKVRSFSALVEKLLIEHVQNIGRKPQ